ncbi:hypothetical protein [Salinibacterium sp. ZJ454]|uniref:COG4315 family predicted lipoprotein n=1 Tax=Salinibacterium sp. ZJ454 TaxID=2708339 RepID=UPI00141F6AB4|nr:hypothetical protein [Salinibacterium sp. ZJ454]
MKLRFATGLAGAALAILLTGCAGGAGSNGTDEQPTDEGTSETTAPEETEAPDSEEYALMTADSDLGEIVVAGNGMTVYMFDNDTQGSGTSTCEGQCATNWPAVTTESASADEIEVEDVTGEVGTITGVDGATQVTLNGWPLYYYIGDMAAGDTTGQGVGGIWWVLSPAGERMAE